MLTVAALKKAPASVPGAGKKALDLSLEKGLNAVFLEAVIYRFRSPAEVAQSVEQGTENPRVGSSILSLGTKEIKGLANLVKPFFLW